METPKLNPRHGSVFGRLAATAGHGGCVFGRPWGVSLGILWRPLSLFPLCGPYRLSGRVFGRFGGVFGEPFGHLAASARIFGAQRS